MKTRTLSRYLGAILIRWVTLSLLGFVALLELLALLDNATDIVDRGLGLAGFGRFLWLRLPGSVDQALVVSVLTGSALAFTSLSRRGEMVILRSVGITITRIYAMLLPIVAIIAGGHFILTDRIVPRAQYALASWWHDTAPPDEEEISAADDGAGDIWFRVSPDIVSVGAVRENGAELMNVRLYERRKDGMLARRITASKAVFDNGAWMMFDAEAIAIDGRRTTRQGPADEVWRTSLRPREVVELTDPSSSLTTFNLRRILSGEGASNRSESYYRTKLQAAYAAPFASFVMLMLGLAGAFGGGRNPRGEMRMLVSLGVGFGFLLINGILNAFGEAGALPPALAAWSGLLIFACVAGTILLRLEEP